MKSTAENSPRVAAHKQRTAEESLITKKQVIQNLSKNLESANKEIVDLNKRIRFLMTLKDNEITELKAKVLSYQSTAWKTRAWLLIRELFGHRTEILQG